MQRTTLFSVLSIAVVTACATSRGFVRTEEPPAPRWAAPALAAAVSVHDGRTGEVLTLDALFDRLATADAVFLGETHLDETTHRFELATYQALAARRPGRVVLAMEMFERDVQPTLDAYLAGTLDEAGFLAKARPWSNYRTGYRPLIEHAKAIRAPVVASNFPAPLRAKLASEGLTALEKLSPEERRLAPAEFFPHRPEYWRRVDNAIRGHLAMMGGMMGGAPAPDDPRLDDTQSLWDNSMGESCALALAAHPGSMVLHVNGGFHSEYWDGTVRQLLLRKPDAKVLTVAIDPSNNPSTDGADGIGGAPRADFVVFAEARAKDIDDGAYAVGIGRELAYRLYVPKGATEPLPLLVWLGDDGLSARETLAEWKERLGDAAAIAVVEPPYRETQEDLLEGGRWFWPDSFAEDVFALREGFERLSGYLLRNQPIDPARVVLAGEGTGATVAAATALLSEQLDLRTLAFAPRRFAKIKDFPLPLPELFGDAERAAKSLALYASAGDEDWWRGELAEYTAIGFANELASVETDPWRGDLARENAVRRALGVAAVEPKADAARRFIVAKSPRERAWARRWVVRQRRDAGETVAVLAAAPTDGSATELETPVRASDFAAGRPLPRCPGPFGGTTVIVLPSGLVGEQVAAWRALEQDDPLAKKSRFHRLRVAHADGPQGLAALLDELFAAGRKNVLIVPAVFCADGATMRELANAARANEDRMTIQWQPGLGALGAD
ncbi:MAG: ChaN family lipoprotein [Planctomycetes bacterium]|nr:ChaN family lipoprotein [Planctomycetota bacterium]